MSDVTLSKAVRSNLLHLQNTSRMMDTTQERLATGKKVNSALDNPTNFFTASSLNARASDIATLLDSMSNGIRTIEAADNGLTAITKTIESMQSTLRQARQDKSFQVQSYAMNLPATLAGDERLIFEGGALGSQSSIQLTTTAPSPTAIPSTFSSEGAATITAVGDLTIDIGGSNVDIPLVTGDTPAVVAAKINDALGPNFARIVGGELMLSNPTGEQFTITDNGAAQELGLTTGIGDVTVDNGTEAGADRTVAKTVDQLVTEINRAYLADDVTPNPLNGAIRASNDNGKLRIENLSTDGLTIDGASATSITGGAAPDPESRAEIGGNSVRANLARQYNETRTELDRLAEDASFNGINLLRGDQLKIVFNEQGTSQIEIQAKGRDGQPRPINTSTLNLLEISADDLDLDTDIDGLLSNLQLALNEVRSQSSDLGSTLSVVQNRENFTKQMINTLETGAANLTLADTNEEAANMLALQTRQQLSQTALSLASQADQAVLRLFG